MSDKDKQQQEQQAKERAEKERQERERQQREGQGQPVTDEPQPWVPPGTEVVTGDEEGNPREDDADDEADEAK